MLNTAHDVISLPFETKQ